jgi:hypothetical protein
VGGDLVVARMFIKDNHLRLALPLIALPGISPRIVTGRKTPSSGISPITSVAGKGAEVAAKFLLPVAIRGEGAGRRMRGSAMLSPGSLPGAAVAYFAAFARSIASTIIVLA